MKIILPLFLLLLFCQCSNSDKNTPPQDTHSFFQVNYPITNDMDSLRDLLSNDLHDTSRLNVLLAYSRKLIRSNPDTVEVILKEAITISDRLIATGIDTFVRLGKSGMANALGAYGTYYDDQSDYSKALDYHKKALAIDRELNDSAGMAKRLNNISSVYFALDDLSRSLDAGFLALEISEKLGSKKDIQRVLGNLGNTFSMQREHAKALEYYQRALQITEAIHDTDGMSFHLGNIGNAYHELFKAAKMGSADQDSLRQKSLYYYERSLIVRQKTKSKRLISTAYAALGNSYKSHAEIPGLEKEVRDSDLVKAKDYHLKAFAIRKGLRSPELILSSMGSLGTINSLEGNYREACFMLFRALAIADSIHQNKPKMQSYNLLSELFSVSNVPLPDTIGGKLLSPEGMRLQAIQFYKRGIAIRDTLFSEENKKQLVRKEMNYEFDKKEAATKAENEKKEALAKEELAQKEAQRNYFIGGFGLVLVLAGFIFRSYRQKQKANEIISHQKMIVEEKQKEILDSIHYAQRIQKSLLPTEKYISKNINRLKN